MSDNTKLIAEAKNYEGDNGSARWPSLITDLATALTNAECDLTELGTAFRDYKIVHPEGTEDLHRKLAEQAAVIEAMYAIVFDPISDYYGEIRVKFDALQAGISSTEGTR